MSHLPLASVLSRVILVVPMTLCLAVAPALADGASKGATPLSAKERAAGFQLLFDGKSTSGWREFGKDKFPDKGWVAKDGLLVHEKNSKDYRAGDIITTEQFDNFELKLEVKLTARGNSGVKYLVTEDKTLGNQKNAVSFEFQVLDDDLHPDAKKGKDGNRTMGSLYDLIPAAKDKVVKPIGEWNELRLVVDGNNVEHWLNGKKAVSFVRGSPELKALIAESKFKEVPGFGDSAKGHILLQDHNDEIAFRNIRIRKLPARKTAMK
jgi:Domain of Unknown Function (DUF1080)